MKYLIYSHAHFDHIAGGKPFKDQGAVVIAHKNAKTHFEWAKKQGALLDSVVMPDQVVDNKKVIAPGRGRRKSSVFKTLHQRGNLDRREFGEGVGDRIWQNDMVAVPHCSACVDDVGDVSLALRWFRPDQRLA